MEALMTVAAFQSSLDQLMLATGTGLIPAEFVCAMEAQVPAAPLSARIRYSQSFVTMKPLPVLIRYPFLGGVGVDRRVGPGWKFAPAETSTGAFATARANLQSAADAAGLVVGKAIEESETGPAGLKAKLLEWDPDSVEAFEDCENREKGALLEEVFMRLSFADERALSSAVSLIMLLFPSYEFVGDRSPPAETEGSFEERVRLYKIAMLDEAAANAVWEVSGLNYAEAAANGFIGWQARPEEFSEPLMNMHKGLRSFAARAFLNAIKETPEGGISPKLLRRVLCRGIYNAFLGGEWASGIYFMRRSAELCDLEGERLFAAQDWLRLASLYTIRDYIDADDWSHVHQAMMTAVSIWEELRMYAPYLNLARELSDAAAHLSAVRPKRADSPGDR
jgi:hypothetical protein